MPDGNPRFAKRPRPESIQFFENCMKSKPTVSNIEVDGDLIYVIKRNKGDLRARLTNIYIVSIADVVEILAESGHVDAIVTVSPYNSYTIQAKEHAREVGVGLFTMAEFNGAVFHAGQDFLDYIPKKSRS
jgi:hypothetical protein